MAEFMTDQQVQEARERAAAQRAQSEDDYQRVKRYGRRALIAGIIGANLPRELQQRAAASATSLRKYLNDEWHFGNEMRVRFGIVDALVPLNLNAGELQEFEEYLAILKARGELKEFEEISKSPFLRAHTHAHATSSSEEDSTAAARSEPSA